MKDGAPKGGLKIRAYKYALAVIRCPDASDTPLQETKEIANMLGAGIITLKGKK
jgi:hypothetical protein